MWSIPRSGQQAPGGSIPPNENVVSSLTIGVSLLALFGVAAFVFFILAMVGAGDVNSRGTINSYFLFAGWGAVPWLAVSAAFLIGAGLLWRSLQRAWSSSDRVLGRPARTR